MTSPPVLARGPALAEVRIDGQGRILHGNAAARRLLGRPVAEAQGQPIGRFLLPADGAPGDPAGLPLGPVDVLRSDGIRLPVRVGLHFQDGLVLRLEDDPDRQRAGLRVGHNEEQLRRAQEVAHVGSWEWDVRRDHIEWSDELYRIFGLEPRSFEPTFKALLEHIHAEDRQLMQEVVQKALEDRRPFRFYHRIRLPDGSTRWLYGQGAVETEEEEVVRMLGTAQDVTESRAAEEKFRALLESAPDAILLTNDRGEIELVNAQAEALFGYSREELVGAPVEVLVPMRLRGGHKGHRADYRPRKRPMGVGRELEAVRKDGSTFAVEVSLSPIETPEGLQVMAAVRDITERRKAEEADRLAFERLLEIEQLKKINSFRTNLLNTASHELNTPLTPLRLELHMLRAGHLGPLTPRQQRAVDVLQRNVGRLSGLIEDVLDVARLESGRLRVETRSVDLAQVVEEAVETYRPAVHAAGLDLVVDLERPVRAEADPDRLTQVLVNLLSNAVKFTQEGRVTVTLEGCASGEVRIRVADTGIGLEPLQIQRLFQPFSQVHEPGGTKRRGTGLGLYICKGILEEHGGTIDVESGGRGHGTTFTLRLPCEVAP